MMLCGDETSKICYIANVNVYRYRTLIKTIFILEQTAVLL